MLPTDLITNLFKLHLARPVLRALASQPLRYRDLVAALGANGPGVIYSRTLNNALRFLVDNGLITHSHRPKISFYAITPFGRDLNDTLENMANTIHKHHQATTTEPTYRRHHDHDHDECKQH